MRHGSTLWMFAACLVVGGCGTASDTDAPTAGSPDEGDSGPCVAYYANSTEIAERGRLVQLDFTFRYGATRSAQMRSGDTSMTLDAQSQIEGKGSQLACAWDSDISDGGVRYEMVRNDGDDARPLAGTHTGTAMLKGTRVSHADGTTIHEEVDVAGPLETLRVVEVGEWDPGAVDACVVLAFDAPLRGRSQMRISAPGQQREEPMDPSGLVLDGYSALSPTTYDGGDHRFLDVAFPICTDEVEEGGFGPPGGLAISDDGHLWQRSGPWKRHASAPLEERTVDFTLRVVPPTLALD